MPKQRLQEKRFKGTTLYANAGVEAYTFPGGQIARTGKLKSLCPNPTFLNILLQTDQVPIGHIPRSMTVHLVGEQTRTVTPGDTVYITGIFLPVPYTGFKALRAGLITDTYLEAHYIEQVK